MPDEPQGFTAKDQFSLLIAARNAVQDPRVGIAVDEMILGFVRALFTAPEEAPTDGGS